MVSGPSGVGKTTLVEELIQSDDLLRSSISTTTRAPREGEVAGTDYIFVTREVFEEIKDRELIEWAEVHGEYYGTPRSMVVDEVAAGRDVVLNIDIQGGIGVKKVFPDAVLIFILPPSFDTLEKRIRKRGGDDNIDIPKRLQNAREEIKASVHYDYLVVNDDLGRAVNSLKAIIASERCRQERHGPEFIAEYGESS